MFVQEGLVVMEATAEIVALWEWAVAEAWRGHFKGHWLEKGLQGWDGWRQDSVHHAGCAALLPRRRPVAHVPH